MTVLVLLAGFLGFMLVVWSVYATNRYALARFGYVPFCLPNAALMLIPNGFWLGALALTDKGAEVTLMAAGGGPGVLVPLVLSLAVAAGVFLLISQRTNGWIAAYAVSLLWIGAAVLVFTIAFWTLAIAKPD
jgi:hypothetical protein